MVFKWWTKKIEYGTCIHKWTMMQTKSTKLTTMYRNEDQQLIKKLYGNIDKEQQRREEIVYSPTHTQKRETRTYVSWRQQYYYYYYYLKKKILQIIFGRFSLGTFSLLAVGRIAFGYFYFIDDEVGNNNNNENNLTAMQTYIVSFHPLFIGKHISSFSLFIQLFFY